MSKDSKNNKVTESENMDKKSESKNEVSQKSSQTSKQTDFYTRENLSEHEILLKIKLPADAFSLSYKQLLKSKLEKTNLKGFRKGHAPTKILEKELKPSVLIETFERLAPYYVNSAVLNEALTPIAPPEYKDLGEFELDKEVTFAVKITIMPKFKLGDLSKIKPEKKEYKATKEEIDNTIKTMFENNKNSIKVKEVNDEWALKIGEFYKFDKVKSLKDLEVVVAEAVESQKLMIVEREAAAKAIAEGIKLSEIKVPEVAIHYEAHEREHAFMHDIERMGTTVEQFTKAQGVTIEQLRERWHKDAQEALENDVLFKLYAEEKKVDVTTEELEAEVNRIKAGAKQRDGAKFDDSGYDDPNWRAHIRNFLLKQKAYTQFVKDIVGELKPAKKAEEKKKVESRKNEGKKEDKVKTDVKSDEKKGKKE